MALARSSGTEFHQVVVALDKGNHAQHQGVTLPPGQSVRLYADGSKQKLLPLVRREGLTSLGQNVEHISFGELDFPERLNTERSAFALLGDGRIVVQADFGIKATCQHSLMFIH